MGEGRCSNSLASWAVVGLPLELPHLGLESRSSARCLDRRSRTVGWGPPQPEVARELGRSLRLARVAPTGFSNHSRMHMAMVVDLSAEA